MALLYNYICYEYYYKTVKMAALQMIYNVYYIVLSPKYNVLVSLLLLLVECILVPVILWKIPCKLYVDDPYSVAMVTVLP